MAVAVEVFVAVVVAGPRVGVGELLVIALEVTADSAAVAAVEQVVAVELLDDLVDDGIAHDVTSGQELIRTCGPVQSPCSTVQSCCLSSSASQSFGRMPSLESHSSSCSKYSATSRPWASSTKVSVSTSICLMVRRINR